MSITTLISDCNILFFSIKHLQKEKYANGGITQLDISECGQEGDTVVFVLMWSKVYYSFWE